MSFSSKQPVALTIAGFDPSNGAGITADLQVFAAHGLFGTAAITALTVQSTRGVMGVHPVDPGLLRRTLAELQADLPPAGIKIGMLGSAAVVKVVAEFLQALPSRPPVVLDPVLQSSSGAGLLEPDALHIFKAELLPTVDWITPNWRELAALSGAPTDRRSHLKPALDRLSMWFPKLGVIATGGDQAEPEDLLRTSDGNYLSLAGTHVETSSNHGTGCAFSSALLCGLLAGLSAADAAIEAKRYIEGALCHAPGLGSGHGPTALLWPLAPHPKAPVI